MNGVSCVWALVKITARLWGVSARATALPPPPLRGMAEVNALNATAAKREILARENILVM